MANHPSALKRARQNQKRRLRNKSYRTRMKTAAKDVKAAIAEGSPEQAMARLREATSLIHKTASKGVIHRNKASRKIARLARQVNRLAQAQG